MKEKIVSDFEKIFEINQIPFMEITNEKNENLDLIIKIYFPKAIINICKFLNDNFILENKENIIIKKDRDGYYKVDLSMEYNNKKINIRIHSMLKNTWGNVKNFVSI